MQIPKDERQFKAVNRRELLKMAPLLLGGAIFVPKLREKILNGGLKFSDWASAKWFRQGHPALTFKDSELADLEDFPVNDYTMDDPQIDYSNWKLKVSGEVKRPGEYSLDDIQKLPKITQNTRHICVEGWDVIGNFSGARISDFLNSVGADSNAKYLYVECGDDYYGSVDMKTAMHQQSLLCYEMYGKPLEKYHGAPLRLSLPTKIGYKSAKYLTELRVTNILERRGYWEDQGYDWYYGL